jgi:hypothetical protein
MLKQILLSALLLLAVCGRTNAQNGSREDSLRFGSGTEEREDVKINEDIRKAIEEGRFVVSPRMRSNGMERMETPRYLDNTGIADSVRMQSLDPYSIPPSVFRLYVLYMHKIDSINARQTCLLSDEARQELEDAVPPETRTGPYVSSTTGGIGGMNFNHILSMVFSPSYRRRAYNATHAVAYKNYYDEGALPPARFTEHERRQLRQSLRNIRISVHTAP